MKLALLWNIFAFVIIEYGEGNNCTYLTRTNLSAILQFLAFFNLQPHYFSLPLGADIVRNDGIYSKYFLSLNERGRYSAKVRVQGSEGTTRITFTTEGQAMPIPGYSENGNNYSATAS